MRDGDVFILGNLFFICYLFYINRGQMPKEKKKKLVAKEQMEEEAD